MKIKDMNVYTYTILIGLLISNGLALFYFDSLFQDDLENRNALKAFAVLTDKKNEVIYKTSDSISWHSIRTNNPLFESDYVFTGDDSTAKVLLLASNVELKLGQNTLVRIGRSEKVPKIEVIKGSFNIKISSAKQKIQLKTKNKKVEIEAQKGADIDIRNDKKNEVVIIPTVSDIKVKSDDKMIDIPKSAVAFLGKDKIKLSDFKIIYPKSDEIIYQVQNTKAILNFKLNNKQHILQHTLYRGEQLVFHKETERTSFDHKLPPGDYKWEVGRKGDASKVVTKFKVAYFAPPIPRETKFITKEELRLFWIGSADKYDLVIKDEKEQVVKNFTDLIKNYKQVSLFPGEFYWQVRQKRGDIKSDWSSPVKFNIVPKKLERKLAQAGDEAKEPKATEELQVAEEPQFEEETQSPEKLQVAEELPVTEEPSKEEALVSSEKIGETKKKTPVKRPENVSVQNNQNYKLNEEVNKNKAKKLSLEKKKVQTEKINKDLSAEKIVESDKKMESEQAASKAKNFTISLQQYAHQIEQTQSNASSSFFATGDITASGQSTELAISAKDLFFAGSYISAYVSQAQVSLELEGQELAESNAAYTKLALSLGYQWMWESISSKLSIGYSETKEFFIVNSNSQNEVSLEDVSLVNLGVSARYSKNRFFGKLGLDTIFNYGVGDMQTYIVPKLGFGYEFSFLLVSMNYKMLNYEKTIQFENTATNFETEGEFSFKEEILSVMLEYRY